MNEDQHRFLLQLAHPPARFTVEQTAWALNCQKHDIPVLVTARLLKHLGDPPANGTKFFCSADILELATNRVWLGKMTDAIYKHWRHKNGTE